ncbi:B3 domain-containing transcription factor VRN1-like [Phaseolus vulgaris]|uniref:B3 domain-containing transcription factor VRN1-like n=1 Tax=Phaseolus vulgaris TaxID=3885 RepID=UPI0035CB8B8F
MASHLGQGSATIPIHFFKIILETNVERIKLPNKFTNRYGGSLPNPVSLRASDFKEWVVYWTEKNGEVWFEKGWKEFAENYSLSYGYFVVFKYSGTSQIDVLILDKSALELDCLSSANASVNPVNATEKEQNARPVASSMVSSHQVFEETLMCNMERDSTVQPVHADKGVPSDKGMHVQPLIRSQCVNPTQSGNCLNLPRTLKARKISNKFKSKHPYFTLVIEPSNLEENASKYVPKFLDNMNCEKNVVLQMANRSSYAWYVKLLSGGDRYDRFSSGWSIFAKESKLEVGDICIFELVEPAGPLLRVHVFRS